VRKLGGIWKRLLDPGEWRLYFNMLTETCDRFELMVVLLYIKGHHSARTVKVQRRSC
jgi:hypothetical protein